MKGLHRFGRVRRGLRNGIETTLVPGAAFNQAADGKGGSLQRAVNPDRITGVNRAGRLEAAAASEVRPERNSIDCNDFQKNPGQRPGRQGAARDGNRVRHQPSILGADRPACVAGRPSHRLELEPAETSACSAGTDLYSGGKIHEFFERDGAAGLSCRLCGWPRSRLSDRGAQAKKKDQLGQDPPPAFFFDRGQGRAAGEPLAFGELSVAHPRPSVSCGLSRDADGAHHGRIWWPCGCGNRVYWRAYDGKVGTCVSSAVQVSISTQFQTNAKTPLRQGILNITK